MFKVFGKKLNNKSGNGSANHFVGLTLSHAFFS